MKVESINPRAVHFVQTDEDELTDYIRFGSDNWVIRTDDGYGRVSSRRKPLLESAFQKEQPDEGYIIQRKLRKRHADGAFPRWHDHPDCRGEPMKVSDAMRRGLMNPSGEYVYRAVRRYDEVVWEGGE
jgi:hypothetical protein